MSGEDNRGNGQAGGPSRSKKNFTMCKFFFLLLGPYTGHVRIPVGKVESVASIPMEVGYIERCEWRR